MANSKGPSSFRNVTYSGKNSLLPPKSPFPSISPSYVDYLHSPAIGGKYIPKPREGNSHHQRTSSESILIEDQPSWLDELLDEPETPVRRAHRRSSSDSFAYMDAANPANMDYAAQDGSRSRNIASVPSWALQDITHHKDARHASFFSEANSMGICRNRAWESPLNSMAHPSGLLSAKDNFVPQDSLAPCTSHVSNDFPSTTTEQKNPVESGPHDRKASADKKDFSCVKASASETDTRRAKQQFAQRSRVRKLQYIAELERNVQALQAEGSEVTAELEFLNQQNLILSMENKALKQRQESLAQEQLIKYLEHEVLEREVGRLRGLYQQQQPQLPTSSHRRTNSRDLDSQFANLNLKHQEPSSGHDAVSGPVHI